MGSGPSGAEGRRTALRSQRWTVCPCKLTRRRPEAEEEGTAREESCRREERPGSAVGRGAIAMEVMGAES